MSIEILVDAGPFQWVKLPSFICLCRVFQQLRVVAWDHLPSPSLTWSFPKNDGFQSRKISEIPQKVRFFQVKHVKTLGGYRSLATKNHCIHLTLRLTCHGSPETQRLTLRLRCSTLKGQKTDPPLIVPKTPRRRGQSMPSHQPNIKTP